MSLHPMDKDLDYEYQRCLNDLDIKGIKLGPNYQDFHPHSIEAMKLYSRLENDNIPILFHQGTSPVTNAPLEYSHPRYIDKIATVFPNLKMILAHLGHPWQEYCMSVVRKHKNVYADLSAQFYRPWSFWQGMNLFSEWGVLDKVFFGSDWPVTTPEQTEEGINNLNVYAKQKHVSNAQPIHIVKVVPIQHVHHVQKIYQPQILKQVLLVIVEGLQEEEKEADKLLLLDQLLNKQELILIKL